MDIHHHVKALEQRGGRRRLASIGLLSAGIAHDFNNLLGNILEYSDLALAEVSPHSTPARALLKIRTIAIRGSEIVRQLMVYIGQEQSRIEPVDMSGVVREMLELLKISITSHAKLTVALGRHLPPVFAAPAEMRELVMNLILNASQALGENDGKIRISTSCRNAPASISGDGAGKRCVQLVVSDTGLGMSPEVREHLFDPFFTMKQHGRGLGLAIVKGIIDRCGGGIEVNSSPGRGATLKIFLPCADHAALKQSVREDESVPLSCGGSAGKTILFADDEQGLRLAASQLLRLRGFQVLEAPDGAAALELLRQHRGAIDAILLDLTMPGASARKIIEEAARICPQASIFLTSAYGRDAAQASISAPHVKGFLQKPYQSGDLVRALSSELEWAEKPVAVAAGAGSQLRSRTSRTLRASANGETGSGK